MIGPKTEADLKPNKGKVSSTHIIIIFGILLCLYTFTLVMSLNYNYAFLTCRRRVEEVRSSQLVRQRRLSRLPVLTRQLLLVREREMTKECH